VIVKRLIFVTGLAAGYVLGARAGRGRYETIARAGRSLAARPAVHTTAGILQAQATHAARIALGRRHHDAASHISPN
jgi:hypothetical protein